MTAFERAGPTLRNLVRLKLVSVPVVARMLVGAVWLVVAWLASSPLTGALLLTVAVIDLLAGSGVSVRHLWRAARTWLAWILLAVAVHTLIAFAQSDPHLIANTLTFALRLLLALAVYLMIALPQDADVLVEELIAMLRLPPRIVHEGLALGRTFAALPADWHAHRLARRSRGHSGGWLGSASNALRTGRARLHGLRSELQLAGASDGSPRTAYRVLEYDTDGWIATAAGLAVASIALLAGPLVG